MNKKFLAAGAGLAVLALSATFVLSMGKTGATTLAGEVTHSHGSSCIIHHYAQVDPTSEKSGVKEYWICCSDPTHTVSYSNPGVGSITDATHGDDFAIDSSDARYIAPYSFPEVFSSQMAYDTPVTVADGKVISSTGTAHIKASVLKDAYEHGYTHMRFHAKAESSEVTNVLGTQDTWQSYSKRYRNDQDNRYWLKSFSGAGEGLKIDSLNFGNHVETNLTLSDFILFKSSFTESWGAGKNYSGYGSVGSTYIALEDGELVIDAAGNRKYIVGGEIPASLMGSVNWGDRAFYVKKVSCGGYSSASQTDESFDLVNVPRLEGGAEIECPYYFENNEGNTQTNEDGFYNVVFGKQEGRGYGLTGTLYDAGALTIGFQNPGAYAIRINYDLIKLWSQDGDGTIMPLPFSNEGKIRVAFSDISITSENNQFNLSLKGSTEHKGAEFKIISTLEPRKTGGTGNFLLCNAAINGGWNGIENDFTEEGGVYTYSSTLTFNEGAGLGLAARFNTDSATGGSLILEYSWID